MNLNLFLNNNGILKGLHALGQSNILKLPFSTENELKNSKQNGLKLVQESIEKKNSPNSFNEKLEFLNSKSINYFPGWNNLSLSICKKNNFFLNSETGEYNCATCNKTGTWEDFKTLAEKLNEENFCTEPTQDLLEEDQPESDLEKNSKLTEEWKKSSEIKKITQSQFDILVKNTLVELEFKKQTFEKFDIRIYDKKLIFPIYDRKKILIDTILVTSSDMEKSNESKMNTSLNIRHIFGQNTLDLKSNEIIITDEIINSLAIWDSFGKPSLVINSIECLTPKVLALFEKFSKIIFWQKDRALSFELAKLLNINRCFLISYSRSPYESLLMDENLSLIIKREQYDLKKKSIIKFEDLREKIYSEVVNIKKFTGIQWKKFTQLNEIMKGHRPGELTILTGPTGSGKTTFLSEYSLDLCTQGLKTLWGSFEIQNHRLAKMMMSQFSGMNLVKNIELFPYISNEFSKLPIYFMDFHGEENIQNVLKTMSNSVVMHDVKHIIIDNLQFMMGNQYLHSVDKFAQQDLIIGSLRRFATNFNCHVTIVIHPRKEEGDELLKISSIFGTAKSTQEADNILILQEKKILNGDKPSSFIKFLEIKKNRFDGEIGKILLKFDRENLCFKASHLNRQIASSNDSVSKSKSTTPKNEIIKIDETISNSFKHDLTNSNNEINLEDNLIIKKFPEDE